MSGISQVFASFSRSMRIFLRDKAIFGSSIILPIFFLLVLPMTLFSDVPAEVMPTLKGYLVIAMISLLIMSTAMSNLPGSIAADRGHDLYSKLSSMPVNPWYECLGRIVTVFVFSGIGSVILVVIGLILGAVLPVTMLGFILTVSISVVIVLTAVGIGLIISCIVRSESAAAHVGLAFVMVFYFIGIAIPYQNIPDLLKPMVQVNPICIGNNMIATVVLGQDFVGYNPMNLSDSLIALTLSSLLFVIGMFLYSRYCWRRT
jgi:ABC-type polysaccharide/polyol phosphate export permease